MRLLGQYKLVATTTCDAVMESVKLIYGSNVDFGESVSMCCWMTIDPLAEKYYHISPYVYCAWNAISLVDPDGMDWYTYTDKNGEEQWQWIFGNTTPTYEDDNGIIWNRSSRNNISLSKNAQSANLSQEENELLNLSKLESTISAGAFAAGGIGTVAEASNVTFRMTDGKGRFDFHRYSSGWDKGNQYVKSAQIYKVSTLGKVLNGVGIAAGIGDLFVSGTQFLCANTVEEQCESIVDIGASAAGFIPGVGPFFSLYWITMGKTVYLNQTLPNIRNGVSMKLPEPY